MSKVIFARSVPVYSEMLLPAWRSCVAYRAEPDHTKLLIVFSVRDETEKTTSPSAPMAETRIKIDAEAEISTTELAAILGVTARRVQQMAQDGTIVPVRRG